MTSITSGEMHIQHYHFFSGCFADNAFITDCEEIKQNITYCGVNVHFQNGIAKRAIRDIQEQAKKQMLHARARWPEVIQLALWPDAVRYAIHIYNTVPSQDDGHSRLEMMQESGMEHLQHCTFSR